MNYLGDFAEDATVYVPLTTHAAAGGAVAPSTAFEAADIRIYKNGSATEKTTTNGITMTSPFDSVTGLHAITIDTSNDTGDSGFWTTAADYWVVLVPDETVDSQTVVAVVATFSIENRVIGATPAEASGRPTKLAAMLRRIFESSSWGNKRTRNRTTGVKALRNAADSADLVSSTQSTASVTDTETQGA